MIYAERKQRMDRVLKDLWGFYEDTVLMESLREDGTEALPGDALEIMDRIDRGIVQPTDAVITCAECGNEEIKGGWIDTKTGATYDNVHCAGHLKRPELRYAY